MFCCYNFGVINKVIEKNAGKYNKKVIAIKYTVNFKLKVVINKIKLYILHFSLKITKII